MKHDNVSSASSNHVATIAQPDFKLKRLARYFSTLRHRRNLSKSLSHTAKIGIVLCSMNSVYAGEAPATDRRQEATYESKRVDNIVNPIRFRFGKAAISELQIEVINKALEGFREKHNLRLEVIGHTDDVRVARPETLRRYTDNYGLSTARARQVAELLSDVLAIPESAIIVDGKADEQPIASNDSEEGRAANRRVEVRIAYDELIVYPEFDYRIEEYTETGPVQIIDVNPTDRIWLAQAPATRIPRMALQAQAEILIQQNQLKESLKVRVDTNFGDFIDRWALEIFEADDLRKNDPLAIVKGEGAPEIGQTINWDGKNSKRPLSNVDGLSYRLRLIDINGREALTRFLTTDLVRDLRLKEKFDTFVYDEETWYEKMEHRNDISSNRFNLPGGLITINARALPVGGKFQVGKDSYPIAMGGSIQVERHLAPGEYKIPITVFDADGEQVENTILETTVAGEYFFMVAIADLTVGENDVSGNVELVQDDPHFDDSVFVDGRLAFYLKGKIKGIYLLTAQLDTGEDELDQIFKDLDRRDPRRLFKRIDPDRHYPVYGDSSTITRDVDTQGKFYARVDWDQSTVLWGNYNTSFSGTELAGFNRGLYGAKADLRDGEVTAHGDEKSTLKVFISEPDTAAAHDELEGTGGSLYYLSHNDLVLGSARLSVEIREKDSGRTREKTDLLEGRDYEIDEFQGRVVLRRPLRSNAGKSLLSIIRDEPLEGDTVVLLADYEYVPTVTGDDRRVTAGARGKHWINDNVGIGATYIQEQKDDVDFRVKSIDVTYKVSSNTYVNFEYAETDATQNIAFNSSIDGGLTYANQNNNDPTADGDAIAINAVVDLGEISGNRVNGQVGIWYRDLDGRFDSLRYNDATVEDRTNFGFEGRVQATENIGVSWRYSNDESGKAESEKIGVQTDYQISDQLTLSGEYQFRKLTGEDNGITQDDDEDTLALRVRYRHSERLSGFATVQHQLSESGAEDNDQFGVGFDFRVNSELRINGEYFDGDSGDGARVGADYRLSDSSTAYLDYTSVSQSNSKRGLTLGQRSQVTDKLLVYQEHRFDKNNSDQQRGDSYGVNYRFNPGWSADFELFSGTTERVGVSFDRRAYSVTSRWKSADMELVNRLEYREDGNVNSENNQWVTTNRFSLNLDDEWSVLGKLDYSETEDDDDSVRLARFAEVDIGLAYRPVFDDRLNMIGMYAFLYDLDPLQQFGSSQFDERSHVLSVEALYDLTDQVTLGGKFAFKKAELRLARDDGKFFDSTTILAVLRARYHLAREWDALLEYRRLEVRQAEDDRQGYLAAVERHLGNNMKVGVGYNFTDFNDDLTSLDFDSQGWFINLLYKR